MRRVAGDVFIHSYATSIKLSVFQQRQVLMYKVDLLVRLHQYLPTW